LKKVDFPEALGRTIRVHREIRRVSLNDMAEHQGLSTSGWSRVETGDTEIRASQLMKVATLFQIPVWQIVKDAEDLINSVSTCEDGKS
jgi:transcriptional regulator with XRE-family HTH domain